MEIERKYLVKRDGSFRSMVVSSTDIAQGYMAVQGATVRIRLRSRSAASDFRKSGSTASSSSSSSSPEGVAYLTIKGPSRDGGLSRYEFEREIPLADAEEMLHLCKGGLVEKTRHIVEYEGHVWEIDEFHGANEGLLMAEVELAEPDEAVILPPFIGPEVTGDPHFYNKRMLTDPYPNWRHLLPEEYR